MNMNGINPEYVVMSAVLVILLILLVYYMICGDKKK